MYYLHDEMKLTYKILVLYTLKDINVETRTIIWEKIFEEEEELINQIWYEIDELNRLNNEVLDFDLNDLEIQYSD